MNPIGKQKRGLELISNNFVEQHIAIRMSFIETSNDAHRYYEDMTEIVFKYLGGGVNTHKKGNNENILNAQGTGVTTLSSLGEDVSRMENRKELLEAELLMAAEKGKSSLSFKKLLELSADFSGDYNGNLDETFSKLTRPLSEEIVEERGE